MKLSQLLIPTLKEIPSEAQIISHKLMLRAGLIRKLSSGLYSYLPLGVKILNKVVKIIRKEMDRAGAQEVIAPILVPKELLEISGRYKVFGDSMMRMKDRHNKEYALSPTNEESITDLVRQEVHSYKDLPINLYQINSKFRDEIRPRFGVLRTREFIMKDAYSFHTDDESLDNMYNLMSTTYRRIFKQCGLDTVPVKADSGAMGGSGSEEFMVRSEIGEETIAECKKCSYVANVEKAECYNSTDKSSELLLDKELINTPNVKTIDEVSKFINASSKTFIKTLIYNYGNENYVMVLIRGDLDVNEVKLSNVLGGVELILPSDEQIKAKLDIPVGFLGPVGIEKNIDIIADYSIKNIVNGVTGANIKDKHYKNVNIEKDFKVTKLADLRIVKDGDLCIKCKSPLKTFKGVEVGHIFKLGKKYTNAFNVNYLDESSNEQCPTMGTYGIGVNRIPAAVIEQCHDENGIIWPITISPFHVIIVPINWNDEQQRNTAENIYNSLINKDIEVVLDDRDLRAGAKFKDADLIGIPIRINIGEKALIKNSVEVKLRDENSFNLVEIKDIVNEVSNIISSKMKALTNS